MIIGLTMLAIVIIANLVGVVLPFILTKLRLDPAVASSPLITTIMDALGLLTLFYNRLRYFEPVLGGDGAGDLQVDPVDAEDPGRSSPPARSASRRILMLNSWMVEPSP